MTFEIWKVLARADRNAKLYPKYYATMVKSFEHAFKDFTVIIDLDVRRTKAALEDPVFYKKLSNILLAYAKYRLDN